MTQLIEFEGYIVKIYHIMKYSLFNLKHSNFHYIANTIKMSYNVHHMIAEWQASVTSKNLTTVHLKNLNFTQIIPTTVNSKIWYRQYSWILLLLQTCQWFQEVSVQLVQSRWRDSRSLVPSDPLEPRQTQKRTPQGLRKPKRGKTSTIRTSIYERTTFKC